MTKSEKAPLLTFRVISIETGQELFVSHGSEEPARNRLTAYTLKSAKHAAKRIFNGPVRVEMLS